MDAMIEEGIVTGNKLIAEFLGLIRKEPNQTYNKPRYYSRDEKDKRKTGRFVGYEDSMRYHSSWNELMLVVEKIESLIGEDGQFEVYIFKACTDIQARDSADHIIEITACKNKIDAVWQAVVQFIQYYNQQSK